MYSEFNIQSNRYLYQFGHILFTKQSFTSISCISSSFCNKAGTYHNPLEMMRFKRLFTKNRSVIAMVHVDALLGSPLFDGSVDKIVTKACKETEIFLKYNVDSILVENMHDIPYVQSKYFGPEVTASMSRICTELRKLVPKHVPFGIQVLAGGNKEALAIAKVCSMDFIRAEGFVFSHIADEGFTDANAGVILRYRKQIQADDVLVFTDIKKKHSSHAITNDVSLVETAEAAKFFLSDGVILTGTSTGNPADIQELQDLKSNVNLPILIGSGVTYENLKDYLSADAVIVGSYFKKNGKWNEDLDVERVGKFMDKFKKQ